MKWFISFVALVHGLIHLMGFLDGTGLKKIPEFEGKTILPLSPSAKVILGYVWLFVMVLFLISIFGLVADRSWWRLTMLAGIVLSQVLIIMWWPAAWAGTIANLILLVAVIFYKHPV